MDLGCDSETIGMEASVDTGGDDGSGPDIAIDRLIGLLASDADQAVAQSAMIMLINLGRRRSGG
jgi:hypothetical protein